MKRASFAVATAVLLVASMACADSSVPSAVRKTDITAKDFDAPAMPRARVILTDAFGGRHAVAVEVAAKRDERTRGLMWRTSLAEGAGMLFVFDGDSELSFWMKNTLIALDMIFIRSDGTVVGIVERAEPQTLSARSPRRLAKYVLEVPAGWSEKAGLKPGLKVQFEGIGAIVPEP